MVIRENKSGKVYLYFHYPLIPNKLYLDPVSTAVIVEGGIVLDNLHNLPQAICILFGLSYALNLKYPKGMINTFNSLFCLGQNKLPPKLQSLKNLLIPYKFVLSYWNSLVSVLY
uniref:Uncharacterized protein n=1 Tax=Oryzias latipes TaxID=8090 RepID=A0A3P9KWW1_ORYLA